MFVYQVLEQAYEPILASTLFSWQLLLFTIRIRETNMSYRFGYRLG